MPLNQKNLKLELYVSNRNEWRSWLKENHAKAEEIWLVYYKKTRERRIQEAIKLLMKNKKLGMK